MAGRPSEYDREITDKICALIEEGSGLKKACEAVGRPFRTFYNWMDEYPELVIAYERACAIRADNEVDHLDALWRNLDPASPFFDQEVKKARLGAYIIQWTAGKHRPKKYNDKLIVVGGNGEGPVEFVIRDMTKKE